MKLNSRETTLLVVFLAFLGLLAGGGLVWTGIRWLAGLVRGNDGLAQRAAALQTAVDNSALWKTREHWLNQHTQVFRSREEASAALLNHIESCARDAGMELKGRQIVDAAESAEPADTEESNYFHTTTIRVKVSGTPQKVLGWIHSLQQPEELIGVTGEVIEAGDEFTAEIDVTKSYFEGRT